MRRGRALAACWGLLLAASALLPPPTLAAPAEDKDKDKRDISSSLSIDGPQAEKLNPIQSVLYNYLEPKPLVDTIKEEEKYGNEGDVLGSVGRGIVSGTESLTQLLSSAVSYPGNLFRRVLRRVSESLNNVGSRIVGL